MLNTPYLNFVKERSKAGGNPSRVDAMLGRNDLKRPSSDRPLGHHYRPVIFSKRSGYRSPCTGICEAAASISRKSSGVSWIETAPMFSSRR